MFVRDSFPEAEAYPRWNWFAVLCYAASVVYSLAVWTGVIYGVGRLVR